MADEAAREPVEAGDMAPDFAVLSDEGTRVRLRDLRGKIVVLYFYPADDTPGCTVEACDFRDGLPKFGALNATVLGVSPDDVASHAKFKTKFDLPFTLLADTDHAVAEAYGVWKQKSMFGRLFYGIERATFIIDGKGRVAKVFRRVRARGHAAAVREAVAQILAA